MRIHNTKIQNIKDYYETYNNFLDSYNTSIEGYKLPYPTHLGVSKSQAIPIINSILNDGNFFAMFGKNYENINERSEDKLFNKALYIANQYIQTQGLPTLYLEH